jgi:outer membrane protein OmpA-like peptidoglycan-associated protein
MGSDINTPGDEMFPYVSPDAKLYFASDGHAGLGRLDLFTATRKDGEITIENLGLPFNSTDDDFGIAMLDKDHGYFSSNRAGGKGDDDIYYFENTRPNETPQNPPITKTDDPNDPNNPNNKANKKTIRYFLAGNVQQIKMMTRDGVSDETKVLLEGVKIKIIDDAEAVIAEVETDKMGAFGPFAVKENKDYTIIAEKPEFYTKREFFSMAGRTIPQDKLTKAETDTTYFVNVAMDKPGKGQIINRLFAIESIYYDLNKADIRQDASIELDKVVQILKDNPSIKLELGSHTDARASFKFNVDLSQRRANSAVQYIISRGVTANRITAKGYGETQLVNRCADGVDCSEEEHQQNRRTEFKVLGVE